MYPASAELNFGIEMEFDFVVLKTVHQAFQRTQEEIRLACRFPEPEWAVYNEGWDSNSEIDENRSDADSDSDFDTLDESTWPVPNQPIQQEEIISKSETGFLDRTDLRTHQLDSLRHYLAAQLSHSLPTCPSTPSLLGYVQLKSPKQGSPYQWHVTSECYNPSRRELALHLGIPISEAREKYRIVLAELVSPILSFSSESSWYPLLHQIHSQLNTETEMGLDVSESGLHVHFSLVNDLLDTPFGLEVIKNVMVLYGLFEHEIEKWFPVQRRETHWCKRVRCGMENSNSNELQASINHGSPKRNIPRYTPHAFAKLIYSAKSKLEVKSATSGFLPPYYEMTEDVEECMEWKHLTVNLSLRRRNKATTLEFRHHHGTIDPVAVRWWVNFLGKLMQAAYADARRGLRFIGFVEPEDEGKVRDVFLDEQLKRSILDIVGMCDEGKSYFRELRYKHHDAEHDAKRGVERFLIENRVRRGLRGETVNSGLDRRIMASNRYRHVVEGLREKFGVILAGSKNDDEEEWI